jgi:hypothetical protein
MLRLLWFRQQRFRLWVELRLRFWVELRLRFRVELGFWVEFGLRFWIQLWLGFQLWFRKFFLRLWIWLQFGLRQWLRMLWLLRWFRQQRFRLGFRFWIRLRIWLRIEFWLWFWLRFFGRLDHESRGIESAGDGYVAVGPRVCQWLRHHRRDRRADQQYQWRDRQLGNLRRKQPVVGR